MIFRQAQGPRGAARRDRRRPGPRRPGWRFGDGSAEHGEPDPVQRVRATSAGLRADRPGLRRSRDGPRPLGHPRRTRTVNNESSEIIRMLGELNACAPHREADLYPRHLRTAIDAVNDRVYDSVNNGVYRRASRRPRRPTRRALTTCCPQPLDWLTAASRPTATCSATRSPRPTGACRDARPLRPGLRRPLQVQPAPHRRLSTTSPAYLATSTRTRDRRHGDFDHIKRHYYVTHPQLNPSRIVPKGPELDLWAPHDRDRLELRRGTPTR